MSHAIRFAQTADADSIAAIYAPYCENTAISFEVRALSPAEMAERIAAIAARYPWLVIEIDGVVAGYAYANSHRERAAYQWSVDTAIYVDSAFHRRGAARALYSALLALLRRQGFYRAYAGVTIPNIASMALHEAFGFTPVGDYHNVGYKLGAWRDVRWFELALQPEILDPSPARLMADLDVAELETALRCGISVIPAV